MTRGVYTAAAGMLASQAAQDTIAQNLANASTIGYKEDIPRFESFDAALASRTTGGSIGVLGSGASLKDVTTDFSQGGMQKSSNPLDVALVGNAALVIQTPEGVRLTRDGSMSLSAQGTLTLSDGQTAVLGVDNKSIQIPGKTKTINISPNGEITADGVKVGQLRLASLTASDNPVKIGENQYTVPILRPASATATVQQGYLESSNVNIVKEMVSMITIMRSYETNQKMIQAEDNATNESVNQVSKV